MISTSCSWWWTTRNRCNKQKNKRKGNQKDNLNENINSERNEESVKPQQWDHSKRLHWHNTFNSSNVFSMFSKEWRFCSNQTVHIKHPGIKFQIFELSFPSHWIPPPNEYQKPEAWRTITFETFSRRQPLSQISLLHFSSFLF